MAAPNAAIGCACACASHHAARPRGAGRRGCPATPRCCVSSIDMRHLFYAVSNQLSACGLCRVVTTPSGLRPPTVSPPYMRTRLIADGALGVTHARVEHGVQDV